MRTTATEDAGAVAGIFDKAARTTLASAAEKIMRGLERDQARILVGADAYIMAALPRLLGVSYGRLTVAAARRLGA